MQSCPASAEQVDDGCPAAAFANFASMEAQQRAKKLYPQPEDDDFDASVLQPIPSPPKQAYFGLLGHAPDLDPLLPVKTYWKLMDEYAPIYQLELNMSYPRVFVGSRVLVNEMADDTRFIKFTHRLHQEMRAVFGDGLFSAESTDPAWWKAHRLLVPAFGSVGLSKMFDDMLDISAQLVQKWDRFSQADRRFEIEVIEDMSRLTFDTIGLCAFGYRFNEFYLEEPHPFMKQLKESIVESGKRANRPDLVNYAYYKDEAHRQENIVQMRKLCRAIIQERLEHPKPEARDLLNVMLHGVDKESGEQLGIENVIYQIPTLLGGGYETTGSTLSFAYYYLCKNPATLRKAQQEVDEVVGKRVLTYDMLRQLKYLDAVMKETLRMQHPVSLLTRFAVQDTVIGGKYLIKKGQMLSGIWRHFHRDPDTWGADADEFKPERMLDENFAQMPPNAWKPFGDGLRACIGRGFAEQEILIHLAMALQKFDVSLVDPTYDLELRGQMGVKPVGLKIRVTRRAGRGLADGIPGGERVEQNEGSKRDSAVTLAAGKESDEEYGTGDLTPVAVFYGGNMGTCESLVASLARSSRSFGLDTSHAMELDDVVDRLPTDRPSIIVVPSYEGRPPDNAKKFVAWLEERVAAGQRLAAGVRYAVLGVGNSDWMHTFHKVPRLVDARLAELGAERILPAEFANVKRDLAGVWEQWSERICRELSGRTAALGRDDGGGAEVVVERAAATTTTTAAAAAAAARATPLADIPTLRPCTVREVRTLASATPHGFAKYHVDLALPAEHAEYRTGDYLSVLPENGPAMVRRVLQRFQLTGEEVVRVVGGGDATAVCFPTPIALEHVLRRRVELAAPVTPRQLAALAAYAPAKSPTARRLVEMQAAEGYAQLVDQRWSVLDVLDELPQLDVPVGVYLQLLLPLAPRLYSIASAPAHTPGVASIVLDIVHAPAHSGHGTFQGVASTFLSSRVVSNSDAVLAAVRPCRVPFHLPADATTPIIMLAAGSGIAPFRAFLQERAALLRAGTPLGPALLFFGCRHPEVDFLYKDELHAWEAQGVVDLFPCFSRPEDPKQRRYVGDALWEQRSRVWPLFHEQEARIYVCGSAARVGASVAATWMRIWEEHTPDADEQSALEWLDREKGAAGRYISDVY